jgi:hypothetical protein
MGAIRMGQDTQQLLGEIAAEVRRIYEEAIDPLSDRYSFERRPAQGEIGSAPTVLMLGNHSSGKSTFINHLLGLPLQRTGVAPTDDAFTLISHGSRSEERDGAAVVSNPDLPYQGLRGFGPGFLSHFKLKVLTHELLKDVTLIDSPGMIDAAKAESGRGYDFTGVVRWFAERADVVIMFFDPEKPGTTGETLQVFTDALTGIDHKLLIVMNKVDQFGSLRDFARAYGALCWNLGKVIPRKDLPMIFTSFVPVEGASESRLPMEDFEKARNELTAEIRRAPARRIDNMITQLHDHASRLQMHARVCAAASGDLLSYAVKMWQVWLGLILIFGFFGIGAIKLQADWWWAALAFGIATLSGVGGWHVIRGAIRRQERTLVAGLTAVFERCYMRELLVRDRAQDLRTQWEVVLPRTRRTVETLGLLSFRRLPRSTDARLARALEEEIPELRSRLHRAVGVTGHLAAR